MDPFKNIPEIDFMQWRKHFVIASVVINIFFIAVIAFRGFNFGIDFTGGTLIEVGYSETADLNEIRQALKNKGFGDSSAQHFGSSKDVLIRLAPRKDVSSADISTKVFEALNSGTKQTVEMRRVEFVGPQVGEELVEKGGLALLAAMGCILVYVWLRFEKRFALGAIIALIHDVIITVGFFSLFQIQFDLTVLAAVLAVIGYSINDSIVVMDRVRDNFRRLRKGTPVEVMNISINQTLSRTMMTSFTTLLVVIALFFFGGELIHGFATALLVGIGVGTYSSVYVASASALMLGVSREDLLPAEKEGGDSQPLL